MKLETAKTMELVMMISTALILLCQLAQDSNAQTQSSRSPLKDILSQHRQTQINLMKKSKDPVSVPQSPSQFHHQMPSVVPTVTVTCEGSYLSLTCDVTGHVLKIKRALFGRITPVQCVAPNAEGVENIMCGLEDDTATEIVAHRCNGRQTCDLHASTTVFNDACPGIYKYLEVNYECSPPAITTTSTAAPTTAATTTTTTTSTLDTIPSTTKETSNEVIYPSRELSSTPAPLKETPSPSSNALPSIAHTSRAQPIMCVDSLTEERNIPVGKVVNQTCPRGGLGFHVSTCGKDGELKVVGELTSCISPWVAFMEQRIMKGNESAQSLTQDLILRTSWSQDLTGGDIKKTTEFVETLTQHLKKTCANKPRDFVKDEALAFTEKIFTVGDNVLKQDSWEEVAISDRKSILMDLVDGLETSAFFLADSMLGATRQNNNNKGTTSVTRVIPRENVLLEVQVSREVSNAGGDAVFPTSGYDASESMGERILIPKKSVDKLRNQYGEVRIVFAAYDKVTAIFNDVHRHPEETKSDGHVISKPISSSSNANEEKGNWTVNSRVLSASVNEGKNRWTNVAAPISITFVNEISVAKDAGKKDDAVRCVFWDYSSSSPSPSSPGRWSTSGCRLVAANETHTECSCDHLTNFAVLMDFDAVFLDNSAHEIQLTIITYAGCIVSIIALFLAFCTFSLLSNLQCARNTIHKNLCFCLLVAEMIFLIGVSKTDNGFLCSAIAVLLHYFFLAAFAWMCLEGVQLYIMLVQVFEGEKSRTAWFYAVGYGFPAAIVAISIVVSEVLYDSTRYGTESFCWLTHQNGFTFAFVGPVVVVLFLNAVFLTIAMYQMCKHAGIGNPSMSKANKTGVHQCPEAQKHQRRNVGISSWIKGSAVLVILLGLTWITGLFFVRKENIIMAYVFTTLNSLQGLFIFLFHCVFNEKVRKEYVKYVRRSTWLPDCVKTCCAGRNQWSTNPSASPHSSSNSSHMWRWLDVRFGRPGQKNNANGVGLASPVGNNSVGNSSSLNRPILARENASLQSIADNGGFDSMPAYERDMRQLSGIDASVVDSEAMSEYMQNQFRCPPMSSLPENMVDAGRADSQMSHDADDYLAPVSCSNTPTPIPLGAPPPSFYPINASNENVVSEEPLYHEIPENHVYAILEPPTLKSKWRPISTLLTAKEAQAACSTLPALRAPQPPTAPPPDESGVVPGFSGIVALNKPDVTLCGNDAVLANGAAGMANGALMRQHHGNLPAELLASFRRQCYSPHEQEKQNRLSQSPSKDLDSIRLSKFHTAMEDEASRCMTSSPSSIHTADVIESHIKASPNRAQAQSQSDLSDVNGFYSTQANGCCRPQVTSASSLASVTLPPGMTSSSTLASLNGPSPLHHLAPPPCVNPCQHPPHHLQHLPAHLHHQHHLPHFSRATTLPCGVDPRLIACSSSSQTCHNHANQLPSTLAADAAVDSVVFHHSHPALCASHPHLHHPQVPSSSCCSYAAAAAAPAPAPVCHSQSCYGSDPSAAMMQHHMQHQLPLQDAAPLRVPSLQNGSSFAAPNGDGNVWSVAHQMRMTSGRTQERDSGLGTSHILSESTLSVGQSETLPSDTSDEELAQLSSYSSNPLQQQPYHQYNNELQPPGMGFGAQNQPQHFQMKPSCKL